MSKIYKFIFGTDGPRGYINSFSDLSGADEVVNIHGEEAEKLMALDIDDAFDIHASLTIQRVDEADMDSQEIESIRKDFFNNPYIEEFLVEFYINSVYLDKKLYFYIADREKNYIFDSEEELIDFIEESFTYSSLGSVVGTDVYYEKQQVVRRDFGFDLIYFGGDPAKLSEEEKELYTPFRGPDVALVCIYKFDELSEYNKFKYDLIIGEDELKDILKYTDDYGIRNENKKIILYAGALSDLAKEYAKSLGIPVVDFIDILRDRKMLESSFHDINMKSLKFREKFISILNNFLNLNEIDRKLGLLNGSSIDFVREE